MALWYGEPLEVHGNALWMRLWGLPQETYAKSLPVDTTPFWQTLYEAVGSVLQNQRASQLRHVRLPIAESVINSCVHVSLTPLLDEEKVCRGVMCALTPTENRNVFQFMV